MTQKVEQSDAMNWIRHRQKVDERINELFDTIGKLMYLEELLREYALASHAPSAPSEQCPGLLPSEAAAQPTEVYVSTDPMKGFLVQRKPEIEHNDH